MIVQQSPYNQHSWGATDMLVQQSPYDQYNCEATDINL
jgi:hypothetical protein